MLGARRPDETAGGLTPVADTGEPEGAAEPSRRLPRRWFVSRLAVVLPLVLVFAAACIPGGAAVDLDGRAFLSTSVPDAGAARPLVPGTTIRLAFQEGRGTASAGCNTLGGASRSEAGRLVTDGLAMTEMGCDPGRHDQDEWLAALLDSKPTIRLSGNELSLETDETVARLLDREVAEPDLPLAGTTWTVESVITGDTVATVPAGVLATLAIGADGQFFVATGCNQGGGTVTAEADTLRFSDLVLTLRGCGGAEAAMEEAVLAVLGADVVAYQIDAASLTLTAGGRGLALRGR